MIPYCGAINQINFINLLTGTWELRKFPKKKVFKIFLTCCATVSKIIIVSILPFHSKSGFRLEDNLVGCPLPLREAAASERGGSPASTAR